MFITTSKAIATIIMQALISQVCWALSYGLTQLLLATIFVTLIFWLIYDASFVYSIVWSIANMLFSFIPFLIVGSLLVQCDMQWDPTNMKAVATYSPMIPAIVYSACSSFMGILFHLYFVSSPKKDLRLVSLALFAANICAAVIRARSIGVL